MGKMIQIRDVPDRLHRRLKAQAAMEGKSLSDYLLQQIRPIAELPTLEEMARRLSDSQPAELSESVVDAVRAERSAR